ncbi:MAG: hypothetical protein WKG07_14615 [Hymenobacter sp.]
MQDGYKVLTLSDKSEVIARAVILTTGVSYRVLDAPGLDRLSGAGVYYGAARTEARSCSDQPVYIIGGGNSAGQAAMYLATYASPGVYRHSGRKPGRQHVGLPHRADCPNPQHRAATPHAGARSLRRARPRSRGYSAGRPASPKSGPPAPCSSSSGPSPAPSGCPTWPSAMPKATCSPAAT